MGKFTTSQLFNKEVTINVEGVPYIAIGIESITPSEGPSSTLTLGASRNSQGVRSYTNAPVAYEIVFVYLDSDLKKALADAFNTGTRDVSIIVEPLEGSSDLSGMTADNVLVTSSPERTFSGGDNQTISITFAVPTSNIRYKDIAGVRV